MQTEVNGFGFIVNSMLSTNVFKLSNKKQQKKDLSNTQPPPWKPASPRQFLHSRLLGQALAYGMENFLHQ